MIGFEFMIGFVVCRESGLRLRRRIAAVGRKRRSAPQCHCSFGLCTDLRVQLSDAHCFSAAEWISHHKPSTGSCYRQITQTLEWA